MSRLIVFASFLVTTTVAMYQDSTSVQGYHLGIATEINLRYQELWNARNFKGLVDELYTEDGVYFGSSYKYEGHANITEAYEKNFNGTDGKITQYSHRRGAEYEHFHCTRGNYCPVTYQGWQQSCCDDNSR